jgi:putative methylase
VIHIRLRQLAIRLSKLNPHPHCDVLLEQYATEGNLAAEWLSKMDGLEGCKVADLGAGNGILGIGANLLGAEKVWLIECDEEVAKTAEKNCEEFPQVEVLLHQITGELPLEIEPQTIIMNPPWGTQKKAADRPFLLSAMRSSANLIHLMHSGKSTHIAAIAESEGWNAEVRMEAEFRLPAKYSHHTSRSSTTAVKCWRLWRR